MQERGPSLRVLVITCKVQMWHTHGVGETSCPSKRERINHIVQSISGLVELLNIQELLHYNWKFCIPPNVLWLCFMSCICSIRTQDFVVKIQLWNGLWFTSPYTFLWVKVSLHVDLILVSLTDASFSLPYNLTVSELYSALRLTMLDSCNQMFGLNAREEPTLRVLVHMWVTNVTHTWGCRNTWRISMRENELHCSVNVRVTRLLLNTQ